MVERDDRIANSTGTAKPPASGGGGANRALARASDAALREGNRLALITNGPDTYDDWLAFLAR